MMLIRGGALVVAGVASALLASALPVRADLGSSAKATAPVPAATVAIMAGRDVAPSAPILMRSFKKEGELEVWKQNRAGRFVLIKTFPICRWSGQLGPKQRVGDRQSPEGFYPIAPRQMNPNSAYHLSFDLGFPNAYDRAHGATGSALMVHGICSSMGCYAMTNGQIQEIYGLARDAFNGGQRAFQFQAYPFRMTARAMARARQDRNIDFWRQLKEGSDRFEATGEEPAVGVAGGRYAFAPSRDPGREALAQARLKGEREAVAKLVEDGSAAVRVTYSDGGQHPTFAALMRSGGIAALGGVSRPEALAFAGREVTVVAARPKPIVVAKAPDVPPAGPVPAAGPVAPAARIDLASLRAGGTAPLFGLAALGPGPLATLGAKLAGSADILPAGFAPVPARLTALPPPASSAVVAQR